MAETQPSAYPEGTDIAGRYRVERVLGQGGMGMVLRARHTWTQRVVALKVILPELAASSGASTRFLREAQSAASLRHPNVVDILDMGRADDGTLFLAMELLEGEPLSRLLDREGPLDPFRAVGLLLPMIDALATAHGQGLVHRDIKPDNLFLANVSGSVVPKLLDFGIARAFRAEGEKLTATGMVLGTPGYMAPEQVAGDPATPAADIWALGVVLFEALSGRPPFDAASALGWMTRVITEPAPALRSVNEHIPEALAAVVDRCLLREPGQRFQDASQLAHALRRATTSPIGVTVMAASPSGESAPRPPRATPITRPSARPAAKRHIPTWVFVVIGAGFSVLALGALGSWIDQRSASTTPSEPESLPASHISSDSPDAPVARDAGVDAFVMDTTPPPPPIALPDEPHRAPRRPPESPPTDRRAPRVSPEDM